MKAIFVTLLVAFLGVVIAQEQDICDTPDTWYADTMTFNPREGRPRYGRIYYDETQERIAFKEEVNNTVLRNIYLHKENKEYRINDTSKTCFSYSLTRPFRPFGPGISDKFGGEYYIGSSDMPKDGVGVDIYSGETERGGRFSGAWIPMDNKVCIPVSEIFVDPERQETDIRRFYNIRLGILDFSVFEPPPTCA